MTIKLNRIDVHHHILPPEYLKSLANIGVTTAVGEPFPEWTPERSISMMDRQGIAVAITSVSVPGIYFVDNSFAKSLARRCNEFSSHLLKKHSDRFGAFAVLPIPDMKASLVELEYALDTLKLDGIVMLTNIEGIYLGDPIFNDLFSKLNEREAVVFVHPNAPPADKLPMVNFRPAILEFVFDTTRAIANLIHSGTVKRFPKIRFIFSHAGGTAPYITWRISFGKKRLINYLKHFYYDVAFSSTRYTLSSLQELVDSTHILFGSDYPFLPELMTSNMIEQLKNYNGFDARTRRSIEQDNALFLFPRFGPR